MKKTKLCYDPQRQKSNNHTRPERLALVRAFDACADKAARTQFISKNSLSRSSIFRWKREFSAATLPDGFDPHGALIASTIERLCEHSEPSEPLLLEAIFTFSAWLRWPNDWALIRRATVVYLCCYLSRKFGNLPLSSLADDDLNLISSLLSLDDLAGALSAETDDYVDFTDYSDLGARYDEKNLMRDVVAYLVSSDPDSNVSLNKAYYLMEGGAFRHRLFKSRRPFDATWRYWGAAAPFLFVEQEYCDFKWSLDPFHEEFMIDVEEIVKGAAQRHLYFRQCVSVIQRLDQRLDQRALKSTPMITLPPSIKPADLEWPSLSQKVQDRLAIFGRKDRVRNGLRSRRT